MRNLHRVLLAPWMASPRSSRWLVVLALAVAVAGAVPGWIYAHAAPPWVWSALVLGAGNSLCWLLLMPNGLFLVLAARRLGVPGITRDVLWSMPLYVVLIIGLPMLLHLPQGHVLAFAVVQLLIAAVVMLYMLLPAYLGLMLCVLLPVSHGITRHLVALPGIEDPRFVSWGSGLVVVLVLLLAWRWRQLLYAEIPTGGPLAPNLINLRRHLSRVQSGSPESGLLRRRPAWMLTRIDLHDVGVRSPVTSLRVALGGVYLPQTAAGRLYQLVFALLTMLGVGALLFVVTMGDDSAGRLLRYLASRDGFTLEGWMFGVFSLVAVMGAVELLLLRWGRVNAELPLLALLPGLSGAGDIKRALLRAAIQRPAGYLGVLLVIGWLVVAGFGFGWPIGMAMLAVSLGSLGYLCTMALGIFGGSPLSGFGRGLLMVAMFVLFSLTLLLPSLWRDWSALSVTRAHVALAISWLLLALFLRWWGRRGWRALQQRPHPFLPN